MPWVAASPESNAVAVPSAAEGTPEQPLTDNQSATSAPAQMTQQNEATAPQQETPALPPVAEERQIPTQRSEVAAPPQETPAPAPPPLAEEQHIGEQQREAAGPQQETSPPPPVVGERPSRSRGAKSWRLGARRRQRLRDGACPNLRPRRSRARPLRRKQRPRIEPRNNGRPTRR